MFVFNLFFFFVLSRHFHFPIPSSKCENDYRYPQVRRFHEIYIYILVEIHTYVCIQYIFVVAGDFLSCLSFTTSQLSGCTSDTDEIYIVCNLLNSQYIYIDFVDIEIGIIGQDILHACTTIHNIYIYMCTYMYIYKCDW